MGYITGPAGQALKVALAGPFKQGLKVDAGVSSGNSLSLTYTGKTIEYVRLKFLGGYYTQSSSDVWYGPQDIELFFTPSKTFSAEYNYIGNLVDGTKTNIYISKNSTITTTAISLKFGIYVTGLITTFYPIWQYEVYYTE